ncbi:MAG: hypothetical protein OSB01_05160 [Nitrosomonadaceae bacterium]|nr:hypothetical protein [Nitrosomonadaceae bacterium]|tara:strand:- start:46 stop:180 length:135 start_codon:yes stop_codon:yes gene_type:complete
MENIAANQGKRMAVLKIFVGEKNLNCNLQSMEFIIPNDFLESQL